MKVEDTVLKDDDICPKICSHPCEFYGNLIGCEYFISVRRACKAQAQVTWDIAYKEGRGEVVEWINYQTNFSGKPTLRGLWQAQVKKWERR